MQGTQTQAPGILHTCSDHTQNPPIRWGFSNKPGAPLEFCYFFINMLTISHVGQGLRLYSFQPQEQEMMDATGLSQTLQSYYIFGAGLAEGRFWTAKNLAGFTVIMK